VELDADTKLVASWLVGAWNSEAATEFMDDLAYWVQLTQAVPSVDCSELADMIKVLEDFEARER
jgi:hypothetical protein